MVMFDVVVLSVNGVVVLLCVDLFVDLINFFIKWKCDVNDDQQDYDDKNFKFQVNGF